MALRKSSTEVLQDAFPGRVSLTPKEVARAIHGEGKDTKKRVEAVRNALDDGTLIPGLRKNGPRWRVPIAALGAALDAQLRAQASRAPPIEPPPRRSKHSTIGPRMLFAQQRAGQVFGEILAALHQLEAEGLGGRLDDALASPAPPRPDRGTRF